jgi:hypothetical protein
MGAISVPFHWLPSKTSHFPGHNTGMTTIRAPSGTRQAQEGVHLTKSLVSQYNKSPVLAGFRPKLFATYSQPSLDLAFAFGARSICSGPCHDKEIFL